MREDNKVPVNSGVGTTSKVVHNVHILDASGSMSGGKYNNALSGINEELEKLKVDNDGNTITNTVIEFHGRTFASRVREGGDVTIEHLFMVPAANCTSIKGVGADGGTPLYQAIGETIEKLMKHINLGEKVIITVFTDGEENESHGIYQDPEVLKKLIKQVEDNYNFTVTYIGTKGDVGTVVRNLGVNMSNTLVHTNTAMSVAASYGTRGKSLKSYSKSVARGAGLDELRQNFFSKTVTKLGNEEEEENKTQP